MINWFGLEFFAITNLFAKHKSWFYVTRVIRADDDDNDDDDHDDNDYDDDNKLKKEQAEDLLQPDMVFWGRSLGTYKRY